MTSQPDATFKLCHSSLRDGWYLALSRTGFKLTAGSRLSFLEHKRTLEPCMQLLGCDLMAFPLLLSSRTDTSTRICCFRRMCSLLNAEPLSKTEQRSRSNNGSNDDPDETANYTTMIPNLSCCDARHTPICCSCMPSGVSTLADSAQPRTHLHIACGTACGTA
jgi:hypothetical protein